MEHKTDGTQRMELKDKQLSGIGVMKGGMARKTRIDGVASVREDLDSESLVVNGTADFKGSIKAGNIDINGMAGVAGQLVTELCLVNGKLSVEESMVAREIKVNGGLKVHGSCKSERLICEGKLKLDALSTGELRLKLEGKSIIRELTASRIEVVGESGWSRSVWQKLLPMSTENGLSAQTIKGDDIYLERTTAGIVRGARVVIGDGCEVGLVEYSGELDVHRGAVVREQRRV
ncbi:Polymer-forming protein [Paenibacillaceae bacterium GAS479]|nr:Polymer-forming protein [Paenibacillaceae bacterium GAS479]